MNKITWLQNFGTNIIKSKMSSHFDHFKEDTYSKTLGTSVIYSPLKILTVKIDTLIGILQHPTTVIPSYILSYIIFYILNKKTLL